MKVRALAVAAIALTVLVAGGAAADTFTVTLVSQTSSTITLGWTAQPGYGYLFSSGGVLRSRTNDASRTSVKFSKVTPASYDVDVIVKGANGHYPLNVPPPVDTTIPTVSITSPADGATISGTINVSANAADNVGVARVDFYRDFAVFATDSTAPYSVAVDTTLLPNGATGFGARAFDAAGNEGFANAVHNTVSNGGTPPPVQCSDGVDNDSDGLVDLADPGCTGPSDDSEINTTPTGCAVTTPNVPDGPDPFGGCWPGPSNTGPNAPASTMVAYTGSCAIDSPNVVIDSRVINCDIRVGPNASGLVISNSYINGAVQQSSGSASFTVRDSFLNGRTNNGFDCTDCGIEGENFTVLRTEVSGTNRASWCQNTCLVRDNYFRTAGNLNPAGGAHASGMRMEQNGQIIHNVLWCSFPVNNPSNGETGCSADLSGYPDFVPIHHNTMDSNLFMANSNDRGNGFCVYGGGTNGKPYSNDPLNATFIVFRNNVFQRGPNGKCGVFGSNTDYVSGRTGNVWTGNRWDDGATVNPG